MKKNISFIFLVALLIGGYVGFLYYTNNQEVNENGPVINVKNSNITVSVKDELDDVLLKGVTASDDEDGNLSDQVVVQGISSFNDNRERTVTYAVFDSDDNVATASATISYSDYSAPYIDLVAPLVNYYYIDESEYYNFIKATSCVDGDVTNDVDINFEYDGNSAQNVTFIASDSTGTTSSLKLKVTWLQNIPSYDITLSSYLVYAPVGTYIDPYSYIASITINGMDLTWLASTVTVDTDYNANVPGQYEFIYRLEREGEYGYSKLVVIVV